MFPVLLRKDNFELRTHADVTRVQCATRAASARPACSYVDAQGREFEQPADLVILSAFAQHNVHLLLLSGIGTPYDPKTGQGVVGRNYAYQITSSVDVFVERYRQSVHGGRRARQAIDEFNGDNFDHGPEKFIGGGYLALWTTGGRPILQHHAAEGRAEMGQRMEEGDGRQLPADASASRRTAAS